MQIGGIRIFFCSHISCIFQNVCSIFIMKFDNKFGVKSVNRYLSTYVIMNGIRHSQISSSNTSVHWQQVHIAWYFKQTAKYHENFVNIPKYLFCWKYKQMMYACSTCHVVMTTNALVAFRITLREITSISLKS